MTMHEWHPTSDWYRQWRETDDPRVIEVIEHDTDPLPPDGDAFAPAYWLEYRGSWYTNEAGSTFRDDELAEAFVTALNAWGWRNLPLVERYLRIFHGARLFTLNGPSQGDTLVIFDSPAHREHIGNEAEHDLTTWSLEEWLRGDIDTWQAHIDGDVWGVGYAVLEERVTTETPINGDDLEAQGWDVEIQSWGYAGEAWARDAAGDFELPDLPTLLPLDV
jgi:hypothetical protein